MSDTDCEAFVKACVKDDLPIVKKLFEKYGGSSMDQLKLTHFRSVDPSSYETTQTPLHASIQANALNVTKYLVEACAADLQARFVYKNSDYCNASCYPMNWPLANVKSAAMIKLLVPYYAAAGKGYQAEQEMIKKYAGRDINRLREIFTDCGISINSTHGRELLQKAINAGDENLIRFIIVECKFTFSSESQKQGFLSSACDKYVNIILMRAIDDAKTAESATTVTTTTMTTTTTATSMKVKGEDIPVHSSIIPNVKTEKESYASVVSKKCTTGGEALARQQSNNVAVKKEKLEENLKKLNLRSSPKRKAMDCSSIDQCIFCDEPVASFFKPCNHQVLCATCANLDKFRAMLNHCPTCGNKVNRIMTKR